MKNAAGKKIFISYRVQDTAGETGRLVDALKQYFADDQLFMDIENLEPGADFVDTIEHSLDSCDVFLAVIGPHWMGDRGGDIRINDPNDWVRMEVGTALQRNIRVVPVLVDGCTLPPAEQLPPDLQPLLRRQAIEISNKRWRYDTDQLIKFLVQKAGIQPMRRVAQPAAATPAAAKNKKTWIFIGAGFALSFFVLIMIGLLFPEEEKGAGTTTGTEQSSQQADPLPLNQNAATEPISSGINREPDEGDTNEVPETLTGQWKEVDEGLTSTFVLKQNGPAINVQVVMNGQVMSSGTGTIKNKEVELHFPLFGVPTMLKATLSADNNLMNGSYIVPATGDEQPIQLVRKN